MFTTPTQGFTPENMGIGVPLDIPLSPVDPGTRDYLFEHIEQEVEARTLSQDQASWLLHVAFSSEREAQNLKNRFTRSSGFNGR